MRKYFNLESEVIGQFRILHLDEFCDLNINFELSVC
jgi:hypothetical protein